MNRPDEAREGRFAARLALGALLISFAPVLVRLTEVAPTVSAFYRQLIGGVILVIVVRARGISFRAGRGTLLALTAAGAFFAADLWSWHRSIHYIGPGLATLLGNLQVIILAVAGALFLGERARWTLWLSIPAALGGLGLIVGLDWSIFDARYRWGLLLGIVTAITYAGYLLSLRRARLLDPRSAAARDLGIASMISAALLGLLMATEGLTPAIGSWSDAGLLGLYAVIAQVLGWLLISSSLPHVPASLVGMLLLLQPVLSMVWDVLFFSRPMSLREGTGMVVVLAAIYLGMRSRTGGSPRPARDD